MPISSSSAAGASVATPTASHTTRAPQASITRWLHTTSTRVLSLTTVKGRFDASGAESWPRMYVPVKKLVVHHTATTNDYTDAAAEVRAIYVYHAKELDWGDIGYHALIGRDGMVYEGRRGRGPGAHLNLAAKSLAPPVAGARGEKWRPRPRRNTRPA